MARRKRNSSKYRTPVLIVVFAVVAFAATSFYLSSVSVDVVQNAESSGENLTPEQKSVIFQQAPDLRSIAGYINTDESISVQSLTEDNKVVMIDFWTYTCINCQRTTPYLNDWHEKYEDDGLVIIGVHSPEFGFEKDYDNVLDAVERFEIKYPVVQDNDFQTWRAYDNRFWPRKYLIDIDGFVRYDHIGEGAYEETEEVIQELLQERADRLNLEGVAESIERPDDAVDVDFRQIGTPEIYFGYKFLQGRNYLGNFNPAGLEDEYTYESVELADRRNSFAYLGGTWFMTGDYSELRSDEGSVGIIYSAKVVNLVASGDGTITVSVDGNEIKTVDVNDEKLYNLVSGDNYGTYSLELDFTGDVRIFAFTFG